MNQITCPACSGPQALGGDCATCFGTCEITQETYNTFIAQRDKFDATQQLRAALALLPIDSIPGIEQTAIIVSSVNNIITVELDSTILSWDEMTQGWV